MSQKEIYRSKISTSYGIVIYTFVNDEIKFLMTLRRDTFCYECMIRGMYNTFDDLKDYISHFTPSEKDRILNHPFDMLWKDLWVSPKRRLYRIEYKKAKEKFTKNYDLIMSLVKNLNQFDAEMWEFPKGKMFSEETPIECALREFEEETNISKESINLIKHAGTFEDSFVGDDRRKYESVFYLGYIHKGDTIPFSYKSCPHNMREDYVSDEVMSIDWLSYKDAMVRCSANKKEILRQVYQFVYGVRPI
jgi:8-oxo-dGTP pyrophosphatase MutT (NUDIX family)